MKNLIKDLQQYFHEIIDTLIDVHPWTKKNELPFFLTDSYDFYEISLFKSPCLLMIAKQNTTSTPKEIHKHWEQVQNIYKGFSIYVQEIISSYNRKRLVERHVPFIIPRNQMYLPQFGIDFREHFRKIHTIERKFLSPAAQTVVIYALTRETTEDISPSFLAKKLGYTLMTLSRAFEELKSIGIGKIVREGKERRWLFSDKKALWEQAKTFLRSPTKKHVWLSHKHPNVIAGLSALSQFSMISPPHLPVFAIGNKHLEEWEKLGIKKLPTSEGATFELEIWNYDPALFAKNGISDPFSLYLSLRALDDERVIIALEEMMEKITW